MGVGRGAWVCGVWVVGGGGCERAQTRVVKEARVWPSPWVTVVMQRAGKASIVGIAVFDIVQPNGKIGW